MKIKAEAILEAAKMIVKAGDDEAFAKQLSESGAFVTANKDLIAAVKIAMHKAENQGRTPAELATARAARLSVDPSDPCCEAD